MELDTPWDFVMLQEVSSETAFGPLAADRMSFGWDENCRASIGELIDVDGHLLLLGSSPWRCNGILVHRRHCTSIVAHRTGIYPSVTLDTEAGRITCVSAHLPNRNYPIMDFVNACLSLHEVCSHVVDTSKLCIGVDANVQLAPRSNEAVGVHTTGPPSCERPPIFAE